MPREDKATRKQNRVDLQKLSQRDIDILALDTKDVMEKYNLEKQQVYDRRFAKKIKVSRINSRSSRLITPKKGRSPKRDVPKRIKLYKLLIPVNRH